MAVTLLQSTLLRDILPPYMIPDPSLLIVLFVSLSFPFGRGLVVSFFLGFLTDLLSGAPEGWNTLFAVCIFALNKGILSRILAKYSRSAFGLFLLDFILKLPYMLILATLFRFPIPSYDKLIRVWAGELFTSLVLMPFLFALLSASMGVQKVRLLKINKNKTR